MGRVNNKRGRIVKENKDVQRCKYCGSPYLTKKYGDFCSELCALLMESKKDSTYRIKPKIVGKAVIESAPDEPNGLVSLTTILDHAGEHDWQEKKLRNILIRCMIKAGINTKRVGKVFRLDCSTVLKIAKGA
jgi:hypothetical protein